ncbi:MAG: BTAD domain-containing putative transcriptional regulator [Propionibacteriaceae bacterium]|nr:BTAD domain-containing putative transcriptional regulator [Propionibacteriaceae bacterium]
MSATPSPPWELTLLGKWQLRRGGQPVKVTPRQRALITALALHGERSREFLATLLWADSTTAQAMGNLRAGVWQIRRRSPGLVLDFDGRLSLAEDVQVDVAELQHNVDRISEMTPENELRMILESLANEALLPGWRDSWVLIERERLHEARVSAYESLAEQFLARNAPRDAIRAALAAVEADPMRESAHRWLAQSHIANGQREKAGHVYQRFRMLSLQKFGLEPSQRFAQLVDAPASAATEVRRKHG